MAESLTSPLFKDERNIRHGFFTRRGGVSSGLFSELNCGITSGDDLDKVMENRRRVAEVMGVGAEKLITCKQVHSLTVMTVTAEWTNDNRPEADAMVTNQPGIALGILTADCVPVLFSDDTAGVIGAAHSGWRGALGGVLEATVNAMKELGARTEHIKVSLGPCIRQPSYEVGPDFPDAFLAKDAAARQFFRPAEKAGHHMFDLPGWVIARLRGMDIGKVAISSIDTYADPYRFFSYRRATHKAEEKVGSLISVIVKDG